LLSRTSFGIAGVEEGELSDQPNGLTPHDLCSAHFFLHEPLPGSDFACKSWYLGVFELDYSRTTFT
jgi:hypothetical protein